MRHTNTFRLYIIATSLFHFFAFLCLSLCSYVNMFICICVYLCMPSTHLFLLPSNPYMYEFLFFVSFLIEFAGVDVDGSSFSPSFPDGSRFFRNQWCWHTTGFSLIQLIISARCVVLHTVFFSLTIIIIVVVLVGAVCFALLYQIPCMCCTCMHKLCVFIFILFIYHSTFYLHI